MWFPVFSADLGRVDYRPVAGQILTAPAAKARIYPMAHVGRGPQASQPSKLGWAQNADTHKRVRHQRGPIFGVFCRFFNILCFIRCLKSQVRGKIGSLKLPVIID
jgi:hypothetical protein